MDFRPGAETAFSVYQQDNVSFPYCLSLCLFFKFSFELDFTFHWIFQLMSSIRSLRCVHFIFKWQSCFFFFQVKKLSFSNLVSLQPLGHPPLCPIQSILHTREAEPSFPRAHLTGLLHGLRLTCRVDRGQQCRSGVC